MLNLPHPLQTLEALHVATSSLKRDTSESKIDYLIQTIKTINGLLNLLQEICLPEFIQLKLLLLDVLISLR